MGREVVLLNNGGARLAVRTKFRRSRRLTDDRATLWTGLGCDSTDFAPEEPAFHGLKHTVHGVSRLDQLRFSGAGELKIVSNIPCHCRGWPVFRNRSRLWSAFLISWMVF